MTLVCPVCRVAPTHSRVGHAQELSSERFENGAHLKIKSFWFTDALSHLSRRHSIIDTHTHILILTHLAIPFLAGNGARIRVAESGQGDSEDTEAHPPAGEPKKNRESARRWFVVGCHS